MANGKGVATREKLSEVAVAQDALRGINNLVKAAPELGLNARRDNAILKAAFEKLDEEIEYDVLHYNCEHFAIECSYVEGLSVEADIARGNPETVVGAPLFSS